MAGAAAEVANCGIIKLGNTRDKIEARAKADVSVAKVSLRLPSGHGGYGKSYHRGPPRRRATKLHQEALRAIKLHDFKTIFSADFVLHAIQVVFDGLLGKREMIGDFFVGQPLGDQRNEL